MASRAILDNARKLFPHTLGTIHSKFGEISLTP